MNHQKVCSVCGDGTVTLKRSTIESTYKDKVETVAFQLLACDSCGSEFAGPAEALANKRSVLAFRKRVDGLLSGQEIRALRERLGLSQKQAAQLFGGGPVAFSKYENDDVAQAESMDKLLRLAGSVPGVVAALKASGDHTEAPALVPGLVEKIGNVFTCNFIAHARADRAEVGFEPIDGGTRKWRQ
jgi:HTH-type transcriptional regulator / antitoxin MqsA